MKKKIFIIAAVIICLSLITGGTLAYFTAEDTARNVITSGKIEVELVEQQLVRDSLQPYPSQPITVMPNVTVSKIVSAKSLYEPAWVRMQYVITVVDAAGEEMEISEEEMTKLFQITPDAESWTHKDGWWYYTAPLEGEQTSKPLFEQIHFAAEMGNEYQGTTVYVDVKLEAVQAANNGATVMEAAGWPEA